MGWTESSTQGKQIVQAASGHSGSWLAWLGGVDDEASEIAQSIVVPAAGATLKYWYGIVSDDLCGYDYGYAMINSTEVKRYNLCNSAQTTTWVEGLVDISASAGQTVALKFRATTDVSGVSSFVLDDVSLTEGGSSIPTETPTVTRDADGEPDADGHAHDPYHVRPVTRRRRCVGGRHGCGRCGAHRHHGCRRQLHAQQSGGRQLHADGGQERLHVHAGFALGHAAAERHGLELHGHLHRVHLHGLGPGDGQRRGAFGRHGCGRCGTQCQHRWQRQLPAQRTGGRQLHADGGQERLHVHAGFALGHAAAERHRQELHGHLHRVHLHGRGPGDGRRRGAFGRHGCGRCGA